MCVPKGPFTDLTDLFTLILDIQSFNRNTFYYLIDFDYIKIQCL